MMGRQSERRRLRTRVEKLGFVIVGSDMEASGVSGQQYGSGGRAARRFPFVDVGER